MKFKAWLSVSLLAITAMVVAVACQKSAGESIPAGQAKLSVYLLDGPTDYNNVFIDIQGLLVKVDTCERVGDSSRHHDDDDYNDRCEKECELWDTLSIRPGVYDILKFQNGLDTLLASGYIPNGKIERIKFVLGTNNSVVVDSVSYPLILKDNKSYVYVDIKHSDIDSLTNSSWQFFLDFNLGKSISYKNNKYYLRPYLKFFGSKATGEIEGKVRPVGSHGVVKAYNSTDTAFAFPRWNEGEFKIRGLKPGTYSVFVEGKNGYKDTTIVNVEVKRGRETELGTITLRK